MVQAKIGQGRLDGMDNNNFIIRENYDRYNFNTNYFWLQPTED